MIVAVKLPGLLAEVPPLPTNVDGLDWHLMSGILPVVSVIALLWVALVVWAVFLRRRARIPRARLLTDDEPPSGRRRHRRHRHRREHRPTNPTLAETGGLPPAKPDPPRGDPA